MDSHGGVSEQLWAQLDQLRNTRTETPLRLYALDGELVSVLDALEQPLTPEMLDAIAGFLHPPQEKAHGLQEHANGQAEPMEQAKQEEQQDEQAIAMDLDETGSSVSEPEPMTSGEAPGPQAEALKPDEPTSSVPEKNKELFPLMVIRTPQQLMERHESAGAWLQPPPAQDSDSTQTEQLLSDQMQIDRTQLSITADTWTQLSSSAQASIADDWPADLVERRKICFLPATRSYLNARAASCVLYWMRSTLRLSHANFALDAALLLSQWLHLPVAVVYLVPSAAMYPPSHSSSVQDAYARRSFTELKSQAARVGLTFHGVTKSLEEVSAVSPVPASRALFELLDGFLPAAVVTDEGFDPCTYRELLGLTQYLHDNSNSALWPLFAMDSTTFLPVYRTSSELQESLAADHTYLDENAFGRVYADRLRSYKPLITADDSLVKLRAACSEMPENKTNEFASEAFSKRLARLQLERVDWAIARALSLQTGDDTSFAESQAMSKLDALLVESMDQPAIQSELQGRGVLSLLPFIRHGSLFSGLVLQRIESMIATFPPPKTPPERKALAMLKVLRSRAMTHLAKDRDYALYLSRWTTIQFMSKQQQLPPSRIPFECVQASAVAYSFLEASRVILPVWITNGSSFDPINTSSYDPYELESARTNDLYWNDIQRFLMDRHYLHPLLIVYWSYRILQWSVSGRAAIATMEALLLKCSMGAMTSPDALFTVWSQLFRLGGQQFMTGEDRGPEASHSAFKQLLDVEIASQPKIDLLHP